MKKHNSLSTEDLEIFKDAIGKTKPIKQDKILPITRSPKNSIIIQNKQATQKKQTIRNNAEFGFSDEYEPELNKTGPMRYTRPDVDTFLAKELRRGIYQPELILDLHGLNLENAKLELAALLGACEKEQARCVCIVHGIGSKILKTKIPHYLVQHPKVMAFHQAPLEWGGNGALLVLVELNEKH